MNLVFQNQEFLYWPNFGSWSVLYPGITSYRTTHLLLAPGLIMRGAIHPLPQYVFMAWCFIFTFNFTFIKLYPYNSYNSSNSRQKNSLNQGLTGVIFTSVSRGAGVLFVPVTSGRFRDVPAAAHFDTVLPFCYCVVLMSVPQADLNCKRASSIWY